MDIQQCPKCGGDGKRLEYIELLPPVFEGLGLHKVKEPGIQYLGYKKLGIKYMGFTETQEGWIVRYWRTHNTIISQCSCGIIGSNGETASKSS